MATVALLVVGVVACGSAEDPVRAAGLDVGSSFVLVEATVDGAPLDLSVAPEPLTLERDETGLHGFSGCNTFNETGMVPRATPDSESPLLPELMVTSMLCAGPDDEPAPVMVVEDAYMDALATTTRADFDDGLLVLLGPYATLVFRAAGDEGTAIGDSPDPDRSRETGSPAPGDGDPLANDGSWVLETATIDGTPLELGDARVDLVGRDGQLGGRAACNDYGADYVVEGTAIEIMPTGGTAMGCVDPLMTIETAYLGALPRVTTVGRDGDTLTLLGGGVKLVFRGEPPLDDEALVGPRWNLESLVDASTATQARGDGFVQFHEDGSMTGSTGCRALEGQWSRDGAGLTVPIMAAEGDCDPALVDQDGFVVGVLEDMGVAIEGDQLTLTSQHGHEPGLTLVLRRAN